MEEKELIIGTVCWFASNGKSYGYIGHGVFTNGQYEKQTYVHYKGILEKNQENPKRKMLYKGDVVRFVIDKGFYCDGTQAKNVEVIVRAISNK